MDWEIQKISNFNMSKMKNPFTPYEQEVLTALYKSLNYCEEYDLPTYEISKVLCDLESKVRNMEVV
tara:strand:+ start:257 stop:454 length:198 start_codon:yes stop_codon:yes gene_type:complete